MDRLIVGVATDRLTLPDLATFTQDIVRAGLLHYRKLIDVAHAVPGFTELELTAFVKVLRTVRANGQRGPLAIVADPKRGEFAQFFVALGVDGRPAQVFRSIHEARAWLFTQAVIDPE
jgi:hypothetical protein